MSALQTPKGIIVSFFLIATAVSAQIPLNVTTDLVLEASYKETIIRIQQPYQPTITLNVVGTSSVTGVATEPGGFRMIYGWYHGTLVWDDVMYHSQDRDLFFMIFDAGGNLWALHTWSGVGEDVPLAVHTDTYAFALQVHQPAADPTTEPSRFLTIAANTSGKTDPNDPNVEVEIVDKTGDTSTEDPEG